MTPLSGPVVAPRSGGKPRQAVLLLHGLGDSGAGLVDLAEIWGEAVPDAVFIAPDAPYPCDMAPYSRQWFSLRDWTQQAIIDGVRAAAPILDRFVDQVREDYELPARRIALMGFSQGSMMALHVAPRRREAVAGVLAYSGALTDPATLTAEVKSRPPVLLVHGEQDDVVPFAALPAAAMALRQNGFDVTALPCPRLGHSIDAAGLAAGSDFLRKIFTAD